MADRHVYPVNHNNPNQATTTYALVTRNIDPSPRQAYIARPR